MADADGGQSEVSPVGSNRPSTSAVWEDFEKHYKTEKCRKIRFAATCLHCHKRYSAYSAHGTEHLTRHLTKCPKKLEKTRGMTQTHIAFNFDGSVRRWEYSAEVARVKLVRMLARLDLPLMIGETEAFKDYIKTAHNPNFSPVSKQTTGRDLFKYYNEKRDKLMVYLKDNVVSSVAITSDIWSGKAKEDYLSVVAHFINADWQLEKRVLGLRLIGVSHNAENIAERVASVLAEYGILNKVFSITLDNASANKNAMDKLKPILKEYLGSDLFLHQRCACHIINLIVKEALAAVNPLIEDFRTAISFMNSSNQRIVAYKSYYIASGVRPRKFGLDMDVRWNSTYLMLKHLLPHKSTFSTFIEANYPRGSGSGFLLTDDHWAMANKILKFLELFYDSTIDLSGVYYPTSPLMIHHLVKIAIHLHRYQHDEHLRSVVQPMIDKYNKYWKNIPDLYSIAFILDPRAKIKGFTKVLRKLHSLFNIDYTNKLLDTRALLFKMYNRYDVMYGSNRLKRVVPPSLSGKKRTAWAEIYDDEELDAATASSNSSELASYLDCDTVSQLDDEFDIMQWWHEHKLTYSILSVLAKDILIVPMIIEERRRRLNPETVEALTCIKDWENAETRLQHMV
ncbi:zinc finger BED domain-containing protein RICESLEEPER 2-like [Miscanthus floridulus]|uniref:zinc finger BED domain-containing protein RICESLEEPER 2-like n=1 Tax=Miscanthus floridulus TaxID=154761 RepID=UPI0034578CB4